MPKAAHKVVVIGHRNPDTDSICSAIAYAELKNKTSDLVCEPRRAGKMNQETEFVLKKFGVKPPRMCTDVNPKIRDVDYREMPGIPGSTSLRKAWEIMRDKQIDTLPVTSADNELEGVITVKDIATANMDVFDTGILAKSQTTYRNILETLGGTMVVGREDDVCTTGHIRIGTATPEMLESTVEKGDNNFRCNIKWGNGDDLCVMESYVRCLMLIIRNKVLLNNGDLQHTKITWFYPISMAPKRLRRLKSTWDDAYQKYFGNGVTGYMTESSAPIQYFFKRYSTATDLINVDIGGGTTDIAFAKDKNISHVTSFRFASNTLFENSFSELDEDNGIVDWHKNEILKLLEEKNLMDLIRVFNSPNNTKPANMASFLFGLKDNTIPQRAGVNVKAIDFNYILQEDEDFKIVFIIFYTAIVYHIAQIVKSLNLEVPRHISFSGNGSKVIRVITTDSKLLARYTKMVFEKLLGKPYGKELDLLGLEKDSNPKESTCKGGIIGTEDEDNRDKTIVFKSDCTGLVTPKDTYANIKDDYKRRTVTAVEDFFKFVLVDMNSAFNFDKNFGVKPSSIRIAQEMAKKDLLTFLEKGISQRCEETEAEDMIEETFFYYPIKGVLNAISAEIYNELQQS